MVQVVTKGTTVSRFPPCPCDVCLDAGLYEPRNPEKCEDCQEWIEFVKRCEEESK